LLGLHSQLLEHQPDMIFDALAFAFATVFRLGSMATTLHHQTAPDAILSQ
jgi:hypothetical protein